MKILLWVTLTLVLSTSASAQDWSVSRGSAPALAPTVSAKNGEVTLRNRAAIATTQQTQDFGLSFTWRFTAGRDEGGYQDVLTVAFATDGTLAQKWAHEVTSGVALALQAHAGEVTLHRKDKTADGLGGAKFKFERDKDYKVQVNRSGQSITVKIDGKEVLKANLPEDCPKIGKIVLYNREPVANIEQISVLSEIKLQLP